MAKPSLFIVCSKEQYSDITSIYEQYLPHYYIIFPYDYIPVLLGSIILETQASSRFIKYLKHIYPATSINWLAQKQHFSFQQIDKADTCLILPNDGKKIPIDSYLEYEEEVRHIGKTGKQTIYFKKEIAPQFILK